MFWGTTATRDAPLCILPIPLRFELFRERFVASRTGTSGMFSVPVSVGYRGEPPDSSSARPVDASALAHHFGRAAPLGNAAPAFSYALEAAAEAESLLSFDLAARRFEQALAMLAIDPGLGDRLEVKLALGDALVAAGVMSRARQTFREVAEEAARDGDRRALGRAALGFSGGITAIEVVTHDAEVCQLLDRAVEALRDDDVLGARLAARLSTAQSHSAPLAQRAELASRARARAVAGGDPSVIAETLAAWCDVVAADHLAERRDAASEIIERGVGIGDVGVEALGRRLLVQALFEAGDLRHAEVEVSRFERASARLGRAEYMWYPPLWRASLALARGQMQARARARAQLEALVPEVRGTNAVLLARLQQGMMALDLADPDLAAGPVIDAEARDAYRADAAGDRDRSAGLAAEQKALIAELRGAFGLGGHPRRAGASAERARTAVRSRIRDALERIEVAHPALGRHLAHSVRTGSYCVYQPDPPVDWTAGEAPHTV